jgi:hypothetical protein
MLLHEGLAQGVDKIGHRIGAFDPDYRFLGGGSRGNGDQTGSDGNNQ